MVDDQLSVVQYVAVVTYQEEEDGCKRRVVSSCS